MVDFALTKLLVEQMTDEDYESGEFVVLEYGKHEYDELADLMDRWHARNYYLISPLPAPEGGKPAVLLRRGRDKSADDVPPPSECTVWGGPLSGTTMAMPQAMALWGEGLINKPTSGVANATAAGRKADRATWEGIVDRVFSEGSGSDDVEFME